MNEHSHTCPIDNDPKTKLDTDKKKVNKPDAKIPAKNKVTLKTISMDITDRQKRMVDELKMGLDAVRSYPKTVTFFGSARLKPGTEYYEKARRLGARCCELGYGVITGGGPGIMQAGNQGTYEQCGTGIGFNIELPFEQVANPYVTHGVDFYYFFTRKVSMTFAGEAYLVFPGGFGTLDEFFEILTLVQTKKMQKVPIILVGTKFWGPLQKWIETTMRDKHETISPGDINLYRIMDDEDEIMKIIKKAKLREED